MLPLVQAQFNDRTMFLGPCIRSQNRKYQSGSGQLDPGGANTEQFQLRGRHSGIRAITVGHAATQERFDHAIGLDEREKKKTEKKRVLLIQ